MPPEHLSIYLADKHIPEPDVMLSELPAPAESTPLPSPEELKQQPDIQLALEVAQNLHRLIG